MCTIRSCENIDLENLFHADFLLLSAYDLPDGGLANTVQHHGVDVHWQRKSVCLLDALRVGVGREAVLVDA